jgi:hypothetical protein
MPVKQTLTSLGFNHFRLKPNQQFSNRHGFTITHFERMRNFSVKVCGSMVVSSNHSGG